MATQEQAYQCLQPKSFAEDLLQTDLQTLSHQEQTHLEHEFANYEKQYPLPGYLK